MIYIYIFNDVKRDSTSPKRAFNVESAVVVGGLHLVFPPFN